MTPQQLVSGYQPIEVLLQFALYSFLRRAVSRRVALTLFAVPETQQHAQPVRIQRQDRMSSRKKKNLLGARIADPRKLLQRFFRFGKRLFEDLVEIAIELLQRDLRDAPELFHSRGGMHSTEAGHFEQGLVVSHQDFRRRQADSLAKSVEGLLPAFVAQQVSDVLEENHPQRIGDPGRFGPAVESSSSLMIFWE